MQFSLQIGLTLRAGIRCLELVRELDGGEYQFEDTLTRRPLTIGRSELIKRIYDNFYQVVVADRPTSSVTSDSVQAGAVDISALSQREKAVLELRYDYVKALRQHKVTLGQRVKIKQVIAKVFELRKDAKAPSTSAVMKWARDYQRSENNPLALVDKYRFKVRSKRLHPAAEALLWKVLKRTYFNRDRQSLRHAHNQLKIEIGRETKVLGLAPAELEVSYATLARRVSEVDLYYRVSTREGSARARMVCRTAFPDGFPQYVMERVEIDHTPLNWVVICDRTGLPLGRPVLTVMIDAYSGYV
jgi:putative transposase